MIILGIVLILLAWLVEIPILYTLGIIFLVVGVILLVLGYAGTPIAGRRHWY